MNPTDLAYVLSVVGAITTGALILFLLSLGAALIHDLVQWVREEWIFRGL